MFSRVSCWCCPLQPLSELRILRSKFPDLWKELRDMEKRAWNNIKSTYSVEELEIRFAFEDERIARGESITSAEFYRKLKLLLGRELSVAEQDAEKQITFFG